MSDETWDRWYNRILAVTVPLFLGVLAWRDLNDGTLDSWPLIAVIAAYGCGMAGVAVRRLTNQRDYDERNGK